jgi:hypothetical protein
MAVELIVTLPVISMVPGVVQVTVPVLPTVRLFVDPVKVNVPVNVRVPLIVNVPLSEIAGFVPNGTVVPEETVRLFELTTTVHRLNDTPAASTICVATP